jgi:hypothetical protein
VRVIERALPPPLSDRPAASFLWPLGKEPVFRVADNFPISNPMDRRGPNVLRSKFLDDDRLVRPSDADGPALRAGDGARDGRRAGKETTTATERTKTIAQGARERTKPSSGGKAARTEAAKPVKAAAGPATKKPVKAGVAASGGGKSSGRSSGGKPASTERSSSRAAKKPLAKATKKPAKAKRR